MDSKWIIAIGGIFSILGAQINEDKNQKKGKLKRFISGNKKLIIVVGGLISIFGAFKGSDEQSKYQAEIIGRTVGNKSYPFIELEYHSYFGRDIDVGTDTQFVLKNKGAFPIHNLEVDFYEYWYPDSDKKMPNTDYFKGKRTFSKQKLKRKKFPANGITPLNLWVSKNQALYPKTNKICYAFEMKFTENEEITFYQYISFRKYRSNIKNNSGNRKSRWEESFLIQRHSKDGITEIDRGGEAKWDKAKAFKINDGTREAIFSKKRDFAYVDGVYFLQLGEKLPEVPHWPEETKDGWLKYEEE